MVLLKFNFTKLNTSKATLFTQLNKSFWKSGKYLIVAQGANSIILNNSYQIHCVKCPWFWVAFVPYATWAVFCTMDETLDVRLPPLFAISNRALKGISSLKKNSSFYLNLIKLYSTQNGYGHVCPIRNVTACKHR